VNRIEAAFERAREEKRAALIVFVTAGDPDLETTAELVPELAAAGADIVELGVPHSDPIAEGPTIQASSQRALQGGVTPARIFELCRSLREVTEVPLVLMGYANNIMAMGEEQYVEACAASGVDGVMPVDLPFDEAPMLGAACGAKGVHQILLVAPTTTPERTVQIAQRSAGWIYCVSVTGVTGARPDLPSDLEALVGRIQRVSALPVCVGFGVSTGEHAREVARIADGVIVGSALVQRVGQGGSRAEIVERAAGFVRELSAAVRSARA
jgi:tryptophan synthase alpha chain